VNEGPVGGWNKVIGAMERGETYYGMEYKRKKTGEEKTRSRKYAGGTKGLLDAIYKNKKGKQAWACKRGKRGRTGRGDEETMGEEGAGWKLRCE